MMIISRSSQKCRSFNSNTIFYVTMRIILFTVYTQFLFFFAHVHVLDMVYLTAMSGVGSSLALATFKTSQILLVGVLGGFSRGFSHFHPATDWPASYELK